MDNVCNRRLFSFPAKHNQVICFRQISYLMYHNCEKVTPLRINISITVNSLVSGHPRELKNVSVSRAVRLRELFP